MISLRQALSPATWVVFDVGTSSDAEGPVADAEWTDVYVYNPGTAPAEVSWSAGHLAAMELGTLVAPPGVTVALTWKRRFTTATLRLRATSPIIPAAYRGRGAGRTALVVQPAPTT